MHLSRRLVTSTFVVVAEKKKKKRTKWVKRFLSDGGDDDLADVGLPAAHRQVHGDPLRDSRRGEARPHQRVVTAPVHAGQQQGVRALSLGHLVRTLAGLHPHELRDLLDRFCAGNAKETKVAVTTMPGTSL